MYKFLSLWCHVLTWHCNFFSSLDWYTVQDPQFISWGKPFDGDLMWQQCSVWQWQVHNYLTWHDHDLNIKPLIFVQCHISLPKSARWESLNFIKQGLGVIVKSLNVMSKWGRDHWIKTNGVSLIVLHLLGSHSGHQQYLSDTSSKEAWSVCAAHYSLTRYRGGHSKRGDLPFTTVHTSYHLGRHRPHPWWCDFWEHCHGIPRRVISPSWAHPSGWRIFWGGGQKLCRYEAGHGASLSQTQLWNWLSDWKTAPLSTGEWGQDWGVGLVQLFNHDCLAHPLQNCCACNLSRRFLR